MRPRADIVHAVGPVPQAAIDIGTVRLNVFPDSSTRAPKLDIEFFYFFGKINMYVNLVPRTNLVSMLVACSAYIQRSVQ